jgi:hypothetical protein
MAFDVNLAMTRTMLADSIARVRKHFPNVVIRSAYVMHFQRDQYEFHGPRGVQGEAKPYYNGSISAYNKYEARAKGWDAWLLSKGIDEE